MEAALAVVINSGGGGDLNNGFSGGGPVATATSVVRQTSLSTSLGDAFSADVTYGWDTVSGSAKIVTPSASGSQGDAVTVSMDAGSDVGQCFSGTLREDDSALSPRRVTNACKSPLYALEEYEQSAITLDDSGKKGLDFYTLTGSSNGTATLQQIVAAVLRIVGVSYSTANFDNPDPLYGTVAPENFTWRTRETAAAYLHRIFEASAGYRLFDSSDGNCYLKQITAVPAGSPDATFTLGQDIARGSTALDSSLGQRGAVLVTGYDDGSGPSTASVGSGLTFGVNSDLIETDALAAIIANYWLPVVSRRQQIVRLTTPRDDLIGPGSTVFVDAWSGLGVSQAMWVKSVTRQISSNGKFRQLLTCVTGAS